MNTGIDFVKKLRPFGCALVVVCFVGFLFLCFSSGREILPDYTPPQSDDYYAQHIPELVQELNDHVLPRLEGVISCRETDGRALVEIEKKSFFETRNALLEHFDESLLDLRQAG